MSPKKDGIANRPSKPPTHMRADGSSIASDGATAARMTISAGPLPPASELAEYNAAHAGLSDVWISSWQREEAHRQEMERQALSISRLDAETRARRVENETYDSVTRRRLGYGLIGLVALLVIAAAISAVAGAPPAVTAALGGGGGLIAFAGVAIDAILRHRRERSRAASESESE